MVAIEIEVPSANTSLLTLFFVIAKVFEAIRASRANPKKRGLLRQR
jgi:hypothetical protein